ncbi:MAG TPA: hypothetical protein VHT75_14055 [Acidimicrobiales bacterium]|nr:hypothetical protein [Acidimicrobiales bacterium]
MFPLTSKEDLMFWHRALAALSVVVAVVVIAPPPVAQAQTAPVVINSWALAPSGPDPGQPGSRPNLTYDLAPGATIHDSVTLFNYGNVPLIFSLYATDAFNDPSGAFDLLPAAKKPTDLGSWVTLPQANLQVKARTSVVLPISITVPPDATPGDHSAAILASNAVQGSSPDGKIVTLDRRTGSRVYLRVQGPLQPLLTVEDVKATYHAALNPLAGSLDVSYTIRNRGNERLGTHQRVVVKNPFGRQMKTLSIPDIQELLPNNGVGFRVHFKNVAAAVFVTPQVDLTPFPVGAPKGTTGPKTSRSKRTWAIPWALLALIVIAGIVWQGIRRFRARPKGTPGPDTSSGPNPPSGSSAPSHYEYSNT